MAVLGNNILFWCCLCNRNLKGDGLRFEVRDELKPKESEDE